jgi:DNA repair exonuclease SbcCD ATPase subunit
VREVADRIFEIEPDGIRDFRGGYDDYVAACGDDHLDVEAVSTRQLRDRSSEVQSRSPDRAARGSRAARTAKADGNAARVRSDGKSLRRRASELAADRDRLLEEIGQAEARLAQIHARFADPAFYAETRREDVRTLEEEEREAAAVVERLMEEWSEVEREHAQLERELASAEVP